MAKKRLTHLSGRGEARMVDVSEKPPTERVEALARVQRLEPSGLLLVSALTASVATSLLALLLPSPRR